MFNIGYQVSDIIWLVQVEETEANYWYRTGFVIGDAYGRIYYRTLFDAPVK